MAETVRFHTLGCKVNQYDSEAMLEIFLESGYRIAGKGVPADICVGEHLHGDGVRANRRVCRRCAASNGRTRAVN